MFFLIIIPFLGHVEKFLAFCPVLLDKQNQPLPSSRGSEKPQG
jgi:hypothetical protein